MPNEQIAESLAKKIADYRLGGIPQPDGEHVLRWVHQFPEAVREGILLETDHIFETTYFSRANATKFLDGLLTNAALAGLDPAAFWQQANLLNIQQHGHSQSEMLALFRGLMAAKYGAAKSGAKSDIFVYIDDVIFTGNRIGNDLEAWLGSKPNHPLEA